MARAPDEIKEKARELYENGVMLKDIASRLDVPEGTVRSWKNRGKWSCNATQEKECNVANKTKRNKVKKQVVAEEVESVMSNDDLTDKQRLFCIYYSKSFNATKSYQKAYGVSYAAANVEGCKLLANPSVREEIMKLKEMAYSKALLKPEDIFQKYMDIAFSDITDYLSFGQEEVPVMGAFGPVMDKETDKPLTKIVNTVKFRESSEVDGTIISEVKQGKDGASIKLGDRMKALQWLSDHMDMATEEQRAKIAQIKAQTDKLTADEKEQLESVVIVNDIQRPDSC
ncbi:phage terminase small subunit [Lacrimispora sphenoides]|uniref:terminase small subunit n=1 Tax=Lacrimispora sphenoides TaxID=29370 RepID=UPI0008BC8E73|nr:terminase small subunit [Lacrimispora sphenoides]SET71336.1 phage terminase small subunit [Lacrimispora sphenoides]